MDMFLEEIKKAKPLKVSAILLSLIMISAMVFSGCTNSSKETIFEYNPHNIAGLERIEFDDSGMFTFSFNEDEALLTYMKTILEDVEHKKTATVLHADSNDLIARFNVSVDKNKETASFSTKLTEATDNLIIRLDCDGKELEVDLSSSALKLSSKYTEGELGVFKGTYTINTSSFTQIYDKKSDSWSDPEHTSESFSIDQ